MSNALGQMGHYGGHLGPQKNMCWEKSKGCEHVFFFFFRVVQFHMMTTTLQKVRTSFSPDFTFRGEKD